MADANVIEEREALDFGNGGARVDLAWECSMQIEPMVQAIMDASRNQADGLHRLIAAIGHRLLEVNGIANRALQDSMETLDDLYFELHGERLPKPEEEACYAMHRAGVSNA